MHLERMCQRFLALSMLPAGKHHVSANQQHNRQKDAAITDCFLPVLIEKRYCVFDF
jgi:hypothetical protein